MMMLDLDAQLVEHENKIIRENSTDYLSAILLDDHLKHIRSHLRLIFYKKGRTHIWEHIKLFYRKRKLGISAVNNVDVMNAILKKKS